MDNQESIRKFKVNLFSCRSRQKIIPALGYTGLFVMLLIVLLALGGVVPTRNLPIHNSTLEEQFHNLLEDLTTSRNFNWLSILIFKTNRQFVYYLELEDMFSFALSAIRIVGISLITTYVAIGMVIGPISHIRGYPDPRAELSGVRNRRAGIEIEISAIQQNRLVRVEGFVVINNLRTVDYRCLLFQTLPHELHQLPRSEAIRLLSLEHEDLDLREREEQLKETAKHSLSPFVMVCRPTQIAAGLIGLSIGLLLFVSLFMTKYYCNLRKA